MSLLTLLTAIMFTLKLLGLFHHGWLVVLAPELFYVALATVVIAGKVVLK